jgi:hypothetical protein
MTNMDRLRQTFNPRFDESTDEWVLKIPVDAREEVRIPLILAKELAPGGGFLRNKRQRYREWLLEKQGGKCAVCGYVIDRNAELDHRPPTGQRGARFIDYERKTSNRVVHKACHRRS